MPMQPASAIGRLTRRAEFVACSKARRVPTPAFLLQARARGDDAPARFGFTTTRKVGGAVERNRMRRRLKEAVRMTEAARSSRGSDYVLLANRDALTRAFALIVADLATALQRVAPKKPLPPAATAHGRTDG